MLFYLVISQGESLLYCLANQEYESDGIASLTSPVNDITKLKETLEKLNFKVFAFANLKLVETLDVLNRFCEILVDAGMYAVFYYAGHGFEHQNVDYIMPVDAQLPLKCDECYSVNFIASKLQERKSKVFMFLDSCRVRLAIKFSSLCLRKCKHEADMIYSIFSTATTQRWRDPPTLVSNHAVPSLISTKLPRGQCEVLYYVYQVMCVFYAVWLANQLLKKHQMSVLCSTRH